MEAAPRPCPRSPVSQQVPPPALQPWEWGVPEALTVMHLGRDIIRLLHRERRSYLNISKLIYVLFCSAVYLSVIFLIFQLDWAKQLLNRAN